MFPVDRPLLRTFQQIFSDSEWRPVFIVPEPQNHLFDDITQQNFESLLSKSRTSRKSMALKQLETHQSRIPCTMASCFDYSQCRTMKIYVYESAANSKYSSFFRSVLESFRASPFITSNPAEACLFIPSVDTSDRDPLSQDFVVDAYEQLWALPYWNNGRNHLLFNTFPGTYPDYYEYMDFDTGMAIHAKSCLTLRSFRSDFDISFPHYKTDSVLPLTIQENTPFKRFLASFKGKRYLYGVGKQVREDLRSVENGQDLLILTTCIHLSDWQRFADRDCKQDNARYATFEYDYLLRNSVFSFVPRGRRINTFRLLEVIAFGSIPVVLSDDMLMPFHEVIDWEGAVVFVPESMVNETDSILRRFSAFDIVAMQKRLQYIWEKCLNTFDQSISTVISLLHNRIFPTARYPIAFFNANTHQVLGTFYRRDLKVSRSELMDPRLPTPRTEFGRYTTVILVHERFDVLFDMIQTKLSRTTRMDKLIVVMNDPGIHEPARNSWPSLYCPIEVYHIHNNSLNNRFLPFPSIHTNAVLSLDDDVYLEPEEIEFGFEVWNEHQERVVGWPARKHVWDQGQWKYDSEFSSGYSMILTGAAFYHRKYHELYSFYLPSSLFNFVFEELNCEDIAFNYLVADFTRQSPVKVTGRWTFPCAKCAERKLSTSNVQGISGHLKNRSTCMQRSADAFGYQPLVTTWNRRDPVIYDGKTARRPDQSQKNKFPIPEPV